LIYFVSSDSVESPVDSVIELGSVVILISSGSVDSFVSLGSVDSVISLGSVDIFVVVSAESFISFRFS
jgi:hypothetical protein